MKKCMLLCFNYFLGFIFSTFFILYTSLNAQDQIIWRVSDWPPAYIFDGPYKGQGMGDGVISYLKDRLPEYEHSTMKMNSKRLKEEIKAGKNVCSATALRRGYYLNSEVDMLVLPQRIYIRRDKIGGMDQKSSISLDEILNDTSLKAGVSHGRYLKKLNAIVANHLNKKNITNIPNYASLIRMLFSGRVDYIIEYPSVIKYFETNYYQTGVITGLYIKEIENISYIKGLVGCPKTEWGRTVINKVNQILLRDRKREEYLEPLLRWYDEEDQKKLKEFYNQLF